MNDQKQEILDQFTKQAKPFANATAINDRHALDLLLNATKANADDTVLDVACGPGIVACAFAEKTHHVTGIDIVPAMIEQAMSLQKKRKLNNVSWETGDVSELPFPDDSFSIVTSRYSFHHLENPGMVLSEMTRVCCSGGKVVLIDVMVAEDQQKAKQFNRMEKLRDPSHVRALPLSEMKTLFHDVGLPSTEIYHYRIELELEGFLKRSFPKKEDEHKIRSMIRGSIEKDDFGIKAHYSGNTIRFTFPIAILVSEK